MGVHESCFAGLGFRLTGGFDTRVGGAAYTSVRVVETDVSGRCAGHVDFDQNGAGEEVGYCHQHVRYFCNADIAGFSDT